MQFNITLNNNVASIDSSEIKVNAIDALNKLKEATHVHFNVKADINNVATDLKALALSQIGGWTKFWDSLGSLFLSCFGYITTARKVDDVFQVIINKQYVIDNDKQDSPEKSKSPSKSLSPVDSAEALKRNLVKARENEAKKFVDELVPDFAKVQRHEIKDLVAEVKEKVKTLDEDKQQACYEYLVSLPRYDLAAAFVDMLKDETREILKDKYGICPEVRSIIEKTPVLKECTDKNDWKHFYILAAELKSKGEVSEAFSKVLEISFLTDKVNELIQQQSFDEAETLINKHRFIDIREDLINQIDYAKQRQLSDFRQIVLNYYYKNNQNLEQYLNLLSNDKKDLAYTFLANVNKFSDAKKYASQITDEKLKLKTFQESGLLSTEEGLKLLSSEEHKDSIDALKDGDYLKAWQHIRYISSLSQYIAVAGAEVYAKNKDWARLVYISDDIRFIDVREHYLKLASEMPNDIKTRSKFFYSLETARSIYEAYHSVENETDASLKAEGYDYLLASRALTFDARWLVDRMSDVALQETMKAKYGLHNDQELKAMPEYAQLKRLIKTDRVQAAAYAKSLNASLFLYYTKKSITRLLDLEEYDEASKLLVNFRYPDVKDDYTKKIANQLSIKEIVKADFESRIRDCISDGSFDDAFEYIDRVKKPSLKEAGYRLLASQEIDFEQARKAFGFVKSILINGVGCLELDDMSPIVAGPIEIMLRNKQFSEAREYVARSESINRIIDQHEIEYLISSKKDAEALKLIEGLPYRSLRRKYLFEIEKIKSERQFPHMAFALANRGNKYPGTELTMKIVETLDSSGIDLLFKGMQGFDVEYQISKIFHRFNSTYETENAIALGFLIFDRTEYDFQKIIEKLLISGDEKGIELSRLLTYSTELKLFKTAIEALYFKNRPFAEKLIKLCSASLDDVYVNLIRLSLDKPSALELSDRILYHRYKDRAKQEIAKKFGDFKLYIETKNSSFWDYSIEEFKKNMQPHEYSTEELKSMEEIVTDNYISDVKVRIELYKLLQEFSDEENKARIEEKIKVCGQSTNGRLHY